jgi:hypothetical protein
MLAMLLLHFIEEALQIPFFANITLVGWDCSACCLRIDFLYQLIQIGLVGAVCEGERGTIREKVAGARCSNTVHLVNKALDDRFGKWISPSWSSCDQGKPSLDLVINDHSGRNGWPACNCAIWSTTDTTFTCLH